MKFFEFIKVTYMLAWRLTLLMVLFPWISSSMYAGFLYLGLPAIVSFCIVVIGGKSLRIWPIWSALRGKGIAYDLKKKRAASKAKYQQSKDVSSGRGVYNELQAKKDALFHQYSAKPEIATSTNAGRMTGYEPKMLQGVVIPTDLDNMVGTPASGLSQSGLSNQAVGAKGEKQMAQILSVTDVNNRRFSSYSYTEGLEMLRKFKTYWSMAIPSQDCAAGNTHQFVADQYDTDVDLVILIGRVLYLVDIKRYRGGDVSYHLLNDHVFVIDNATGSRVGSPLKISGNMDMAYNRYREYFTEFEIEKINSVVVLVPTERGQGKVAYTDTDFKWGKNSTLITIDRFLADLSIEAGDKPYKRAGVSERYVPGGVHEKLSAMVKN